MDKYVEKIYDVILKSRHNSLNATRLENYADYLILTLDGLKEREANSSMIAPGGFTYYAYIKNTIDTIKYNFKKKTLPEDLAWQRLEHIAERISEAIEIFYKENTWK